MVICHQQTKHSFISIRKNSFFLDWRTQPKNFKIYPHFHQRFKIDDYEELKNLNLIGGITYEKQYPQGSYYLRTNPSAGGLYPCEIYIQIRGIKGILNGIYHYESKSATLCLLHELNSDGVEFYFRDKRQQKGLTFLVSTIYFRSSWKYQNRSIRYILLDSGHQLGSIYAALCVMGKESEFVFDFEKRELNEMFGFRDDEMMMCALNSSTPKEVEAKKLTQQLSYVSGCDYLEKNEFVEDAYKQSCSYESQNISKINFFNSTPKEQLKDAIMKRRSIRAFKQTPITCSEFDYIVNGLFEFATTYSIDIFYTVHSVESKKMGLYKNGTLVKEGIFHEKSKYLSLEQNLGGQSAVTFYFTSDDAPNYQKVNILSGFLAQIIYLKSELQGVGCSGIGAYYDDKAKEFLGTTNSILYLLAIGK
ncbi:MAG: SagB family peptide dehydrogenase [Campylobacterota bacterium]|nr:SagB family peptide dehydrogenase [Campylobacterota bacterium]